MLLRERAWDVMRTDFVNVRETTSLRETAKALRKVMRTQPNQACAVVTGPDGEYRGVVTAWWLLLYMEKCALEDSLRLSVGADFEETFRNISRKCFARPVTNALERDVPVVKPQDPLFVVLQAMLSTRRRWAVVVEGGKVLGVIAAEDVFLELELEVEGREG